MMKMKLSKQDLWICIYLYFVFQTFFQSISTGLIHTMFKYSDDVLVLSLFLLLMIKAARNKVKLSRDEKQILIMYGIFESLGILFGLLSDHQRAIYVFLDGFTCAKFLILFFSAQILSSGRLSERWMLKYNPLCKIVAVLLFFLLVHELFFCPFFEKAEYRYFTHSLKFFFTHPEGLARASAAFIYPLAYNMRFHKKNMKYILMLCIVMLFTFRSKSIAAMFVILAIYFYKKVLNGKHISVLFVGIAAMALFIGYDQIKYYYGHALIGRTKLLTDSIYLANKMFPFGSGFGSFGSNVALDHHSSLYEAMGYFTAENPWAVKEYLNDAFWPIIFAQVGWIGSIFFIITIGWFLKVGVDYYKKDFYVAWVFISVIMYDLVSTLASSAFFHPISLSSYLLLGLIISSVSSDKNKKEEKNHEGRIYIS